MDRAIAHDKAAADKTVAGEILVVGVWHTFAGGQIDWFFNATRDRPGTAYDPPWQLQMGRFSFWNELGKT